MLSFLRRLHTPRIRTADESKTPTRPTEQAFQAVKNLTPRLYALSANDLGAMFGVADAVLDEDLSESSASDIQSEEAEWIKKLTRVAALPDDFEARNESDLDMWFYTMFGWHLLVLMGLAFGPAVIGIFTQSGIGLEKADHVFATFSGLALCSWLFAVEMKTRGTFYREGWRRMSALLQTGAYRLQEVEGDWCLCRERETVDVGDKQRLWWATQLRRVTLGPAILYPLVQGLGCLLGPIDPKNPIERPRFVLITNFAEGVLLVSDHVNGIGISPPIRFESPETNPLPDTRAAPWLTEERREYSKRQYEKFDYKTWREAKSKSRPLEAKNEKLDPLWNAPQVETYETTLPLLIMQMVHVSLAERSMLGERNDGKREGASNEDE